MVQKQSQVYEKHIKDIFRYALYHVGNREKAEDIASEAFKVYYEKENRAEIRNTKAWLIAVTRNLIYKSYKEKSNIHSLDQITKDSGFLPSDTSDITEDIISQELLSIIKKELSRLDQKSREVIVLRIWEKMKFKDIAQVINEKETTVKLRYYRAIDKIKSRTSKHKKDWAIITVPLIKENIHKLSNAKFYQLPKTLLQAKRSNNSHIANNKFLHASLIISTATVIITAYIAITIFSEPVQITEPKEEVSETVYPENYSIKPEVTSSQQIELVEINNTNRCDNTSEKLYINNNINLSFCYPSSWGIEESVSNNIFGRNSIVSVLGDGDVYLSSANFLLTDSEGKSLRNWVEDYHQLYGEEFNSTLLHETQYKIDNHNSITIGPNSIGEAFTIYAMTNDGKILSIYVLEKAPEGYDGKTPTYDKDYLPLLEQLIDSIEL